MPQRQKEDVMQARTIPPVSSVALQRITAALVLFALMGEAAWSQERPQEVLRTCEEVTFTVPWYVTPENEDGAAFSVNATYNANITTSQRAVIEQAIADWEAIIKDAGALPNPYPISFLNGPLSGTTIGLHSKVLDASGLPVSSTITVDNDGSVCWYIDPTPASDTEFTSGASPCASSSGNCSTDGTTSCTGNSTDLLTVVRHEVGHAMGWTSTTTLTSFLTGVMFDSGRWTIAMEPGGTMHADPAVFPGDLMIPSIGSNSRRAIELYPDAVVGALHYTRDITMGFVDVDGPFLFGMAGFPWDTVVKGLAFGESGEPLLLAPGTYDEVGTTSLEVTSAQTLLATNGGSAVIR
jgi:hypothetical protein